MSSVDPTDNHALLLNARRRDFAADKRKREESDSRAAESEARGAALRRLSQQGGGSSSPKASTNGFPSRLIEDTHAPAPTNSSGRAAALQRLVRESMDVVPATNDYAPSSMSNTNHTDDLDTSEPYACHSTVVSGSATERTVQLLAAARRGGMGAGMSEVQEDERRLFGSSSQASPSPASGSRLAHLRRVAADLGIPCGGSNAVELPASSSSATILTTQPRNPGGCSNGRVACGASTKASTTACTASADDTTTTKASETPKTGGASSSPQARPAEINAQQKQLPSLRRTSNPSPAQQKRSSSNKGGKGGKK